MTGSQSGASPYAQATSTISSDYRGVIEVLPCDGKLGGIVADIDKVVGEFKKMLESELSSSERTPETRIERKRRYAATFLKRMVGTGVLDPVGMNTQQLVGAMFLWMGISGLDIDDVRDFDSSRPTKGISDVLSWQLGSGECSCYGFRVESGVVVDAFDDDAQAKLPGLDGA